METGRAGQRKRKKKEKNLPITYCRPAVRAAPSSSTRLTGK